MTLTAPTTDTQNVLSSDKFREHWQSHRRLTRKTIEAYPEDKLFSYSVAGMRTAGELFQEMLGMVIPGVKGIASGTWLKAEDMPELAAWKKAPTTKAELLARWDKSTEVINEVFPTITSERFQEPDVAFGQWPGTGTEFVLYFIDNEIHHRGQVYVYLRSLGVEPPYFWERA